MSKNPSPGRRKFLTASASVVGGLGVATAIAPFLSAWQPSKKALAAGSSVSVDVSKMQEGQLITVEWRSRPIWILRRNQEQLSTLSKVVELISDPNSDDSKQPSDAKNDYRSINPEFLVLEGICTHLGCVPLYRPNKDVELGADWEGGFFCPCHGSKFDLAGRVYKSVPAPTNLPIPPYKFVGENKILIGESKEA
jgi:ubiquinol-cytochrome c reductase iron-sulfur subunit